MHKTVQEHYDTHLASFYSWYAGDFDENKKCFQNFCTKFLFTSNIKPFYSKNTIDLGAGNGIQSIALAELGFNVKAIDFSKQLLSELKEKIRDLSVETIYEDIRFVKKFKSFNAELITCCGDTLAHLESFMDIKNLLKDIAFILSPFGKIILTFRDYSTELKGDGRFIPVKSDSNKILTCFLEYNSSAADEYNSSTVRVTDLLYEFENGKWIQKVSSYKKTRVTRNKIIEILNEVGFEICIDTSLSGMVALIGQKLS